MDMMNITVQANDGVNRPSKGYVVVDFIGVNRPPQFPECTQIQAQLLEGESENTGVVNVRPPSQKFQIDTSIKYPYDQNCLKAFVHYI